MASQYSGRSDHISRYLRRSGVQMVAMSAFYSRHLRLHSSRMARLTSFSCVAQVMGRQPSRSNSAVGQQITARFCERSSRNQWRRPRINCRYSPDPQIIHLFQRRSALPTDQCMAISAHQRLADWLGALRAVKIGLRLGLTIGHVSYIYPLVSICSVPTNFGKILIVFTP
jgi:hypothetical protein